MLGSFLAELTRAGEDVACRYGGEELVLIMPGASEESAYQKAENIRTGMMQRPAPGSMTIILSLGVAAYPRHGATADEVLRAANAALLKAKVEGRNQTILAG